MALQQQRIAVLEEGLGVKNSLLKTPAPTFNTPNPPVTSSADNTAMFSASISQTQHPPSSKQPEIVQKVEERLDPATFKDELSKIRSQLNDSAAEFSRFKELALAKQQVLEDSSRSPLPSSPQLRPPKSPPKGSPKPSRPPPSVPRNTTAQISPRRMDSAKLQEELTKRRSTLNRVPQPRESRCFATGSRPSSQFITGPVGQLTALLSTISKQLSLHSRVSPPPTSALPALPTYEKITNLTHPTPVTQPNTATQPSQPSQGHAKDIQSLFFMLEKELTVIEEEVKTGKQSTS
ncbi:hypothetical protein BKA69DRAFT_480679 [Paraphysoderma sedebokerense]|nr:hypothetical protein BKA69DRAFT_480679 [Paraphysoderma sedebokerense]